jgi:hypothetical protein
MPSGIAIPMPTAVITPSVINTVAFSIGSAAPGSTRPPTMATLPL